MPRQWSTVVQSGIFIEVLEAYRDRLPELGFQLLHTDSPLSVNELHTLAPEIEVLFGPGDGLDATFFEATTRLRVVSLVSSGYDQVDLDAATHAGVVVTITPAPIAEAVADLTWGLILGIARQIPQRYALLKHERTADTSLGRLVYGQTLGILGLGYAGKAVVRRAQGFAMRVLACSFSDHWDADFASAHGVQRVDLDELLQESDFPSIHLRYTPTLAGLIGARELALMKSSAFLINTARAGLVDEEALHLALKAGRLAGAATDVNTDRGADSPLLHLPNVICTPHIGGRCLETAYAQVDEAIQNAQMVLCNQRPVMVVNPQAYTVMQDRLAGEQ